MLSTCAAGVPAANKYGLVLVDDMMYFFSDVGATLEWGSSCMGQGDHDDAGIASADAGPLQAPADLPPRYSGPDQQEQVKGTSAMAHVMPVCLIKPVADGCEVITEEELQAKVTWGVREVKATGTKLTGAGVKVRNVQAVRHVPLMNKLWM